MPNHYCFEENFKLLKRSKTIYFLLTELNFFEFGTSWMVWIFWAHVSKAFSGLYQIPLTRWQHNSFLKAENFLRIGLVSLIWFAKRLRDLRQNHNKSKAFFNFIQSNCQKLQKSWIYRSPDKKEQVVCEQSKVLTQL